MNDVVSLSYEFLPKKKKNVTVHQTEIVDEHAIDNVLLFQMNLKGCIVNFSINPLTLFHKT